MTDGACGRSPACVLRPAPTGRRRRTRGTPGAAEPPPGDDQPRLAGLHRRSARRCHRPWRARARLWLTIAAAAVFAACYVWLVFIWVEDRRRWRAWVLAALLTAGDRPDGPQPLLLGLPVLLRGGLHGAGRALGLELSGGPRHRRRSLGATALGGGDAGAAAGYAISAVGVGLLLSLMRDLRTRNQELTEARAELARTAVAAERERFARDLHDLLGHSLSVIAIKAELAGRLLPDRVDEAAGRSATSSRLPARRSARCARRSAAIASRRWPGRWRARGSRSRPPGSSPSSSARRSRSIPTWRRCWPGRCARGRRT